MALDVKRGAVIHPITRTVANGKYTKLVTSFNLNGISCEFVGGSPLHPDYPFEEGDNIVAAGKFNKKGIFKVTAAHLPSDGITLVESPGMLFFGGGWLISSAIGISLFQIQSNYKASNTTLFLIISLATIGIISVWTGFMKRAAKRMVESE